MFKWLFGKKKKAPKIQVIEITQECSCNPITELLGNLLSGYIDMIMAKAHSAKTEKEQNEFFENFEELCNRDCLFDPMHIAALIIRQQIINSLTENEESKDEVSEKKEVKSSNKKSSKSTKKSNSKKK